ncbi:MAG TPA: peptidyl-tRNA hydrolase, partial [Rhizobiales bacterium]|nr:peptidyl-tRNA hydrolase [Hyphomicrobiales bacterium]
MKLIAGLGNPGAKYTNNRHNIGFMAVDEIARVYSFPGWRKRFQGEAAGGLIDGEKVLLLKPSTYMNESGRAVGEAMRYFNLSPADVFVIHDELDLPPGKMRTKTGGGHA